MDIRSCKLAVPNLKNKIIMTEFIMSTSLLILVAIAAAVRIQKERKRKASESAGQIRDNVTPDMQYDYLLSESDRRTIDIIGREAFMDMARRVNRILTEHNTEDSITVTLTCGPSDSRSEARLHALLPGDELRLSAHMENGVEVVDVYSDEFKIGSLVLTEAASVIKVMENCRLTGCFVAEQNCYHSPGYVKLDIVVFFSASNRSLINMEQMKKLIGSCRIRLREARPGSFPLDFYAN